MDAVISFTPASLAAGFLTVCAGISCIAAAMGWIIKAINAAKAPGKKVNDRLTAVENAIAQHSKFFDSDKKRLDALEEGNRVTQQALLALLAHGIDGNDIEAMVEAKKALETYLIRR